MRLWESRLFFSAFFAVPYVWYNQELW